MNFLPSDKAFFQKCELPTDSADYGLNFSGIRIKISGVEAYWASLLEKRYSCFVENDFSRNFDIVIQVVRSTVDHFIEPDSSTQSQSYKLSTLYKDGILYMSSFSFAGWLDVNNFEGQLACALSQVEPRDRSIENYLRPALAWFTMHKGGFLMHSASILRNGMVYLFFGPSESGKSTLAAFSKEGRVISDDLTVILPSDSGFMVLGTPFRGTYEGGTPLSGIFPLHSLYRIEKDRKCFIEKRQVSHFIADFIGSLPFINDQLTQRQDILSRIISIAQRLPIYALHFKKDADFWPVIDELK